ncbi:MAG: hypothetical protein NTV58_12305 [Deltaproteobacteria bacterium]|nr:hypothetical protein [Deltaproteobacteria bacterium]
MAEEYVSQVRLEVGDKGSITDFKSVEENEFEVYKTVPLMNSTGHIKTRERHGVKLEYVVPKDTPPSDFSTVKNATIKIYRDNGANVTYSGVYVTKIGSVKYDGDKEATQMIEFSAKNRKVGA